MAGRTWRALASSSLTWLTLATNFSILTDLASTSLTWLTLASSLSGLALASSLPTFADPVASTFLTWLTL